MRAVQQWGRALVALLGAHAAVAALDAVNSLVEHVLISGALRGEVTRERLDASVSRGEVLASSMLVLSVVTAAVFIRWLGLVTRSCDARRAPVLEWVFFVPLGYRMLRRITGALGLSREALPWPMFTWWAAFQLAVVLGALAGLAEEHARGAGAGIEAFRTADRWRAGAAVVWSLAAVLGICGFVLPVVRAIRARHTERA